jgi:hypothetical protein
MLKLGANTLKLLAFRNAEYLKCLYPKMLNVIRKTLLTNSSIKVLINHI